MSKYGTGSDVALSAGNSRSVIFADNVIPSDEMLSLNSQVGVGTEDVSFVAQHVGRADIAIEGLKVHCAALLRRIVGRNN
ncbi:MAG: hypothetical protein OSA08_00870 [Arenicellales bacterium]|nr:hypothetical protein [Arenicellales bacterium]